MKNFGRKDWKNFIPTPVYDEKPEYLELYIKAWELAFDHIKSIDGMPQNPYMDEAFCATQVWIWDTCFMSLFCKYAREAFPGVETLNNFYEVLYGTKRLPKILVPENEPKWTNAVPGEMFEIKVHIADNPPLFAWAEYENAMLSGDLEYIKELLYERGFLQKHYEWMESLKETLKFDYVKEPTCLIAEKFGYRWEGGRSGMDNTPRGRIGDHAYDIRPNNPDMLWVDAICEQALSARMISKLFALVGDTENAAEWNKRYTEKSEIINNLYWDDSDGFYYDIDINTHEHYKVMTPASFWAMTAELAPRDRAERMSKYVSDPKTLGGKVPLTSLSRSDNDYVPDGEYWRGGVWMPTAYAALKGLSSYGFHAQAHEAADKIISHMYKTYTAFEPHTIWEAYSPEEYMPSTTAHRCGKLVRRDFCGWSALGPISMFIEFVLGFHSINAFENIVEWEKPAGIGGRIGIKNLRFGEVITDIEADGNSLCVKSNKEYTLKLCGKEYSIKSGENKFSLD